jgi:hypothetical protein
MRYFALALLLTITAWQAMAADIVTATVTLSKAPIGNTNSITVNASTRTWTNAPASNPALLIQETNSVSWSATNLLNHLTIYPVSTAHRLKQSNPTNVIVVGSVGEALTITIAGGWAAVSYTTNTISSPVYTVRVPASVEAADVSTNVASQLTIYLERSTNALSASAKVLENVVNLSSNQTVAGNKTFTGTNSLSNGGWNRPSISNATLISGIMGSTTNGVSTNQVLNSPILTNGANYGRAFRSVGSGIQSEQFGTNAVASGNYSLAVGSHATASGDYGIAIGNASIASNYSAIALGVSAIALGTNSFAVGSESFAGETDSFAIGTASSATHSKSIVIGVQSASTSTNQITLGSAAYSVYIPGIVTSPTSTNGILLGTNRLHGDLSFNRYSNSTLVNGNNAGIEIGTNVIVELSGPSTIAQIAGFRQGRDGEWRRVRITGAVTNIIVNEVNSAYSTDPTAARRIVTGTGGDLALTNQPSWLEIIYRGASSRWEVTGNSR